MTQHLIVAGSPVDGYTFYGPFSDDGDAYNFAEGLDADWVLAHCVEPAAQPMLVRGPSPDAPPTEQQFPHDFQGTARCQRWTPGGGGCRVAGNGGDNGPCEWHPNYPTPALECPNCGMKDQVIVVDISVRENPAEVVEGNDDTFILTINTEDADHHTDHYLCGNCRTRVVLPDNVDENWG